MLPTLTPSPTFLPPAPTPHLLAASSGQKLPTSILALIILATILPLVLLALWLVVRRRHHRRMYGGALQASPLLRLGPFGESKLALMSAGDRSSVDSWMDEVALPGKVLDIKEVLGRSRMLKSV